MYIFQFSYTFPSQYWYKNNIFPGFEKRIFDDL